MMTNIKHKKKPRAKWLHKKIIFSKNAPMLKLLKSLNLNTICNEARCPNITECYENKEASFLILGRICTRGCTFCNVEHGKPKPPDKDEPTKIAKAVKQLGLRHVVITSPTRDDLKYGGAEYFAETIQKIREFSPNTKIETLIPDFKGDKKAFEILKKARPDILSHNLETVEALYRIRKNADYYRSLDLLRYFSLHPKPLLTKSGIMLGLGETLPQVYKLLSDLIDAECRFISIGQYLSPDKNNEEVKEYIKPEIFEQYRKKALSMGFKHVESAPYVRSSYNAYKYLLE